MNLFLRVLKDARRTWRSWNRWNTTPDWGSACVYQVGYFCPLYTYTCTCTYTYECMNFPRESLSKTSRALWKLGFDCRFQKWRQAILNQFSSHYFTPSVWEICFLCYTPDYAPDTQAAYSGWSYVPTVRHLLLWKYSLCLKYSEAY